MSFAVYNADCWCESCAKSIKESIVKEIIEDMWSDMRRRFPKTVLDPLTDQHKEELTETLIDYMDRQTADTDDWPSTGNPEEATDGPQHCGAGETCDEAEDLGDGCKIGALLGTDLTDHGVDYLNEMIGEKPTNDHQRRVHEFWRQSFEHYDLVADPSDPAEEE